MAKSLHERTLLKQDKQLADMVTSVLMPHEALSSIHQQLPSFSGLSDVAADTEMALL